MRKLLLLTLLLFFTPRVHAQTVTNHCSADGNGSNASCGFTENANRMLIAAVWGYLSQPAMSDTKGQAWSGSASNPSCTVYAGGPSFDVGHIEYVWTGSNSGSTTFTGTSPGTSTIIVAEVSGLLNTTPDPSNGACNGQDTGVSPGGTVSSGNFTTTVSNDFLFGWAQSADPLFTTGSGFTLIDSIVVHFSGVQGPMIAEWKSTTTAGSYAATAVQPTGPNFHWFAFGLAFKTAAAGSNPVKHRAQVIRHKRKKVNHAQILTAAL